MPTLIFPHNLHVPESTELLLHNYQQGFLLLTAIQTNSDNQISFTALPIASSTDPFSLPALTTQDVIIFRTSSSPDRHIHHHPDLPPHSLTVVQYLINLFCTSQVSVSQIDLTSPSAFRDFFLSYSNFASARTPKTLYNESHLQPSEVADPFVQLSTPQPTESAQSAIEDFITNSKPSVLRITLIENGKMFEAERLHWLQPSKLINLMESASGPRFYLLRGQYQIVLIAHLSRGVKDRHPQETGLSQLGHVRLIRALHSALPNGLRISLSRRYRFDIDNEEITRLCNLLGTGEKQSTLTLFPGEVSSQYTTILRDEFRDYIARSAEEELQPVSRPAVSQCVIE